MNRFPSLKGKGFLFLFFLWSLWFLNFIGKTVFAPVLPLFEDEFGIGHAGAGSIVTVLFASYACALFFSPLITDYLGPKRSIIAYLVACGLTFLCMPLVGGMGSLYLACAVIGLACGFYLPNAIPLITSYYEQGLWGKAICMHESAVPVAVFAGPLVVLFFLYFVSWRTMFAVLGIPFLIAAVLCAWKVRDVRPEEKKRCFQFSLLKDKKLWLLGAIWALASGSYLAVYFIMPLYLTREWHVEAAKANMTFGLSRIAAIPVAIAAGFWVDRFSIRKTTLAILVVAGVLTMLLTVRDVAWIERILYLQAAVIPAFMPLSLVFISRMYSEEERGQVTGFVATCGAVCGLGGITYLLGLCGDLVSFRVGLFALGLLTALSGFLLPASR